MSRVVSWTIGKCCLLWLVTLDKTLLAFALLHFVLQSQTYLFVQVSLEFLLLHSKTLWWRGYLVFNFFGVSSRRYCKSSHSPGKNTVVGCHALLQGIFPTQGSNPGLLHGRQILYQLSYQGSSKKYWSGLPCPPPGDLPNPGTEPRSPSLQVDSLPAEPQGKPELALLILIFTYILRQHCRHTIVTFMYTV